MRTERVCHPNYIAYMSTIANHPNYAGLPLSRRKDGTYCWVVKKSTETGKQRIEWCIRRAQELGLPIRAGVYADVMLAIHPTKRKVCQTCGREMSLYYHYPNVRFLQALNNTFHTDFSTCDHISDIWDALQEEGEEARFKRFLIRKGELSLPATATKQEVIDALEYACRKGKKSCLGPGAMSDFPDRFDGFHSYNRCCRGTQDTGRSAENMRSYSKDRRAYEYWSDGNIHAANQFMHSPLFNGTSADHIGPVSLGFVHDPRYLQPMKKGENSAKRDRLSYGDIEAIIETENRTKVYPMSWFSSEIWEFIRANYRRSPMHIETEYRDALKQNMANFMFVLWRISFTCGTAGDDFLVNALLRKNFSSFDYDYSFNERGEITSSRPRRITERGAHETDRYRRIALEAVYDYHWKDNRHAEPDLDGAECDMLETLCRTVLKKDEETAKNLLHRLMEHIQKRIISTLSKNEP